MGQTLCCDSTGQAMQAPALTSPQQGRRQDASTDRSPMKTHLRRSRESHFSGTSYKLPEFPDEINQQELTNSYIQKRNQYLPMQNMSFDGRIIHEKVEDTYKIKRELGKGSYGTVSVIRKRSYPWKRFAMKSIHRDRICYDVKMVERELDILMSIDHPNIINFHEIYMDDRYFHFIQQLCDGSDLFTNLRASQDNSNNASDEVELTKCNQQCAAKIVKQILMAIKHLHEQGIVHRDLKLENIMVETAQLDEKEPMIKVIDFGLAGYFKESEEDMTTVLGTPYYIAPEVINGQYNQACDMWSIGVIVYSLLCGYPPFNAEQEGELYQKILSGKYSFPEQDWDDIHIQAKMFISDALKVEPEARMTVDEALKHPWITMNNKQEPRNIDERVIKSLMSHGGLDPLQKHILKIFVSLIKPDSIKHIRKAFEIFDKQHNGTLSNKDLYLGLLSSGVRDLGEANTRPHFDAIRGASPTITWTQFLYASLDSTILNPESLKSVFKFLDSNKQGAITADELTKSLIRRGHIFSQSTRELVSLDEVVALAGLSEKESTLDFCKFCNIMGYQVQKEDALEETAASIQQLDESVQ